MVVVEEVRGLFKHDVIALLRIGPIDVVLLEGVTLGRSIKDPANDKSHLTLSVTEKLTSRKQSICANGPSLLTRS